MAVGIFVYCGGGVGMGMVMPGLKGGLHPVRTNEFLNDTFEDGEHDLPSSGDI